MFNFGKKNRVVVNGVKYETSFGNVVIKNGKLSINGENVVSGIGSYAEVVIYGDIGNIEATGSVEVHGNSGDIDCGGSCTVDGDVSGSIDAGGSVTCGNVQGDIDAGGSVRCKR